MDGVVELLEDSREELGGLGEPVWSSAILAVRQLEAQRDRLLDLLEEQVKTINKRNIHVREQKKEITELKGRVTILEKRGPSERCPTCSRPQFGASVSCPDPFHTQETSLSEELMRAFGDGG